jgi:hypothetical protein
MNPKLVWQEGESLAAGARALRTDPGLILWPGVCRFVEAATRINAVVLSTAAPSMLFSRSFMSPLLMVFLLVAALL